MAELADAPDLGSGGTPVQVQVLLPAPHCRKLRIACGGFFTKVTPYCAGSLLQDKCRRARFSKSCWWGAQLYCSFSSAMRTAIYIIKALPEKLLSGRALSVFTRLQLMSADRIRYSFKSEGHCVINIFLIPDRFGNLEFPHCSYINYHLLTIMCS